jgi:hypothetical protein
MELSGKVIQLLPEVGGQSKSSGNAWRKQEFIVETGGQYPKKVCVSLWGDKIDQFSVKMGENINLGVDVESREYNGKWYTEVKAYKVDRTGVTGQQEKRIEENNLEIDTFHSDSEEDKLPF